MNYDDMLDRAASGTSEVTGTDERLSVPDPEVRQEGSATVVENFRTLCNRLGRDPNHVRQCLQREVGTSGHIDETGRARITGSFDAARLGEAITTYIEEFVRCPACGLPDTRLESDGGTTMLRCEACGARSATPSQD